MVVMVIRVAGSTGAAGSAAPLPSSYGVSGGSTVPGGGYSHYGLAGGPVGLRVLPNVTKWPNLEKYHYHLGVFEVDTTSWGTSN